MLLLHHKYPLSTPWSCAQSENGCLALARSFAANLNIQPSQKVGVARGYGVVTFINDDNSGLRDPSKLQTAAPTVESLDACDDHRCFVTLRRCGVSLSSPQPHDAKVFSRLTHVDPKLPKALHRLLAELVRLGNPERCSAPIPSQPQSHHCFSRDASLAAASRQTDYSSTAPSPVCEQSANTCENVLLVVVQRGQADRPADGQFGVSATANRRRKLDGESEVQNESPRLLSTPALRRRQALKLKRIAQLAQQRRPVHREREPSKILRVKLLSDCLTGEPPRVCRRPFELSYAAMAGSSSMG